MTSKKGFELLKNLATYFSESDGFDKVMKGVTFVAGGNGKCTAELKVKAEHLNKLGGLHGGFSSTLVDSITTCALMTHDIENIRAGVSVDLHVSFLKGARENDEIIVEAKTIRCGKTLAFLECEIRSKKDSSILVKGSHTKFVGQG